MSRRLLRGLPSGLPRVTAGQLWILPQAGEIPELWLVIGVAGETARLAPADLDPQVGSGDLAVPSGSRCGALTLRGRQTVRVPFDQVRRGHLVGSIEEPYLEGLRGKVQALDRGQPVGSILERDTDTDSDYQELSATLRCAAARLVPKSPPASARLVRKSPPRATRPRPARARNLAAAVLLLASGLGSGWLLRGSVRPLSIAPVNQRPLVLAEVPWINADENLRGGESPIVYLDNAATTADSGCYRAILVLPYGTESGRFRVEMRGPTGSLIHATAVRLGQTPQVMLRLADRHYPPGLYVLELHRLDTADAAPIRYRLRLESRTPPPG